MALIDDDKVKEVGRVIAEQSEAVPALGQCLIDREVHFTTMNGSPDSIL
jgi:hypothetical protein